MLIDVAVRLHDREMIGLKRAARVACLSNGGTIDVLDNAEPAKLERAFATFARYSDLGDVGGPWAVPESA